VDSIDKSIPFYRDILGMKQTTEIITDPIQKVKVVLLSPQEGSRETTQIELIEEIEQPSPISNILKQKNRLYHYCFEVDSIDEALIEARETRMIVLGKPVPAKLFKDRKIVFLFTPDRYLIELLEKD
jgi:catechol 2,3-dioxygenase-like lactoylglutathione lyase family enzyme